MKKLGVVVVCLALLAAGLLFLKQGIKGLDRKPATVPSAAQENYASWKEFKPKSGLFKVLLPSPPQYAKDLVPIPGKDEKRRYDMYASEKIDGTIFLISVISYPTDPQSSEVAQILKQTVDELMRSKPDNHLSKNTEAIFKNLPSLDFKIDNDELQVEGKVFMRGKNVYVLSYVARADQFGTDEFRHFVDSFELLPNEKVEKS